MSEPFSQFFTTDRPQFFRPLTSKYRELLVECLKLLYARLYTSMADYGHALQREQMLELFQAALVRLPEDVRAARTEIEEEVVASESRFRSDRELANWLLTTLVDAGWLEVQVDEVSLQAHYQFSRTGRVFAQAFVELGGGSVRTRHRNTRNTRNALRAFLEDQEVHDLLDAGEYSERIISDFTDIITELEERKRHLVRELEITDLIKRASDEFFDFMEKRFQPDLSVRLSADSVEKYRNEIASLVQRIRRLPKEDKARAEARLRQIMPSRAVPGQSILWELLDAIETRLANACDIMLPALRSSLRNFTRRADIIIRQMSYLASQRHGDIVQVCQDLAKAEPQEQANRLLQAGQLMGGINLKLLDPESVVIKERKTAILVDTLIPEAEEVDLEARKELFIRYALDQAFVIQEEQTRRYLVESLQGGDQIQTRHLPVRAASDFLAATHAIELASVNNSSSEFQITADYAGATFANEYLAQADDFRISIRPRSPEDSEQ